MSSPRPPTPLKGSDQYSASPNQSDEGDLKSVSFEKLHQTLTKSHDEDALNHEQDIENYMESQRDKTLQRLKEEERRLLAKIEEAGNQLDKEEEKYNKLNAIHESLEKPESQYLETGDFYHRMNVYEVYEAFNKGEAEGLAENLKYLKEEIAAQERLNKITRNKIEDATKELPAGFIASDSLSQGDVVALETQKRANRAFYGNVEKKRAQLKEYEASIEKLVKECTYLQSAVRTKANELQLFQEGEHGKLQEDYQSIKALLQEKKEELKKVLQEERARQKDKTESGDNFESNEKWKTERENMLKTIKKMKHELRQLRHRDSMPTKSNTTAENPKKLVGYLYSIAQAELDLLNRPEDHPIMTAIMIERETEQRLLEEKTRLKETAKKIRAFDERTFGSGELESADKSARNKKQRIALLEAELAELREEFRRIQDSKR